MAATGFTPISLYYSTTASAVPLAGNLANGELALNTADMKLYAKNSSGTVTLLASNASTTPVTPAGSNTQIQFNNSGSFGASSGLTWNGTSIGWSATNIILSATSTASSALFRVQGSTGDQWQFGSGISLAGDWGVTNNTRSISPIVISGGSTTPTISLNSGGGNVGIGTSSPSTNLQVNLSTNTRGILINNTATGLAGIALTSNSSSWYVENRASNNSNNFWITNSAGSAQITITAAGGFSVGTTADPGGGAIYATGAITAYYSDKRLKTISGKIENALDKVAKLSGVYYTNNDTAKSFGYDSDEVQVGVIAQEVEAVLPQIVKPAPFDLDENNNSKSGQNYKTVQYEKLTPLLIEAINELRAEVTALKGTI